MLAFRQLDGASARNVGILAGTMPWGAATMLDSTWVIIRRRWTDLGLIGAANLVAQILTYVLIAGLLVPLLFGYLGVRGRLMLPANDGLALRELIALATGAAGLGTLVILPGALAAAAFMLAGLLGAVARIGRGEPVGFLAYFDEGLKGFSRAFGLSLLFAIGLLAAAVLLGGLLFPWGFFLWALLIVPGALYFQLYPTYLTTVAGRGIGEALREAWAALLRDPAEAVIASLLVIGFAIGYALLLGLLMRLGLLGLLGIAFLQVMAVPALMLVLVERFRAQSLPLA